MYNELLERYIKDVSSITGHSISWLYRIRRGDFVPQRPTILALSVLDDHSQRLGFVPNKMAAADIRKAWRFIEMTGGDVAAQLVGVSSRQMHRYRKSGQMPGYVLLAVLKACLVFEKNLLPVPVSLPGRVGEETAETFQGIK